MLGCISGEGFSFAGSKTTPLDILKEREVEYGNARGEVYLGKVMTLVYPAYAIEADDQYHSFLLELTDVLKTPLRDNYRIVLKGYSDRSGSPGANLDLSRKRSEALKKLLIDKYFMCAERITAEAYGEANPVASNETSEGRGLNRRVEVHIYGDVSEAVRTMDIQEEAHEDP